MSLPDLYLMMKSYYASRVTCAVDRGCDIYGLMLDHFLGFVIILNSDVPALVAGMELL